MLIDLAGKCGKTGTYLQYQPEQKLENIFWKKILALCFQNYKMHIPSGLAIPQLGIYPRKIIRYVQNACMHAKSLQQCPTLCAPMNCSLPDSSVHMILQARILEWVAMPSSRGIFPAQVLNPQFSISCTDRQVHYHQRHLGSPSSYM